jgi:hypothetical protein
VSTAVVRSAATATALPARSVKRPTSTFTVAVPVRFVCGVNRAV